MGIAAVVALILLVGVLLVNAPANPQPLPPPQETPTQDCGCGVPGNPRGPR
jgi:hypothetical protein